MDLMKILRKSWRITWRRWELWLLSLAMSGSLAPVILITGGFAFAFAFNDQALPSRIFPSMRWIEKLTTGQWLVIALGCMLLISLSTALSIYFQGGAARLALFASEEKPAGLREALAFSPAQRSRIVRLGLIFGLVSALLVFVPIILPHLLPPGPARQPAMAMLQTVVSPFSSLLGLILLLLVISAATDDLLPPTATRRLVDILKTGWWALLFVFGLGLVIGVGVGMAFAATLIPLMMITIAITLQARSMWVVMLPCFGLLGLALILFTLFSAVFTLVLYTLVYREAAERAAATPAAVLPA